MSLFDWFADRRKGQFVGKVTQESEESDGLWEKCAECGQVVYRKDFSATWCGPCQTFKPIMNEIKSEGYYVEFIDIDNLSDLWYILTNN